MCNFIAQGGNERQNDRIGDETTETEVQTRKAVIASEVGWVAKKEGGVEGEE